MVITLQKQEAVEKLKEFLKQEKVYGGQVYTYTKKGENLLDSVLNLATSVDLENIIAELGGASKVLGLTEDLQVRVQN